MYMIVKLTNRKLLKCRTWHTKRRSPRIETLWPVYPCKYAVLVLELYPYYHKNVNSIHVMYMYIPPYGFSTETVDLRLELVQCYVEVSCCIAGLKN